MHRVKVAMALRALSSAIDTEMTQTDLQYNALSGHLRQAKNDIDMLLAVAWEVTKTPVRDAAVLDHGETLAFIVKALRR